MDLLQAIHSRRSIREFTGEKISDSQLTTILKAGFQAPSANNLQPREYIVVRDKDILERIPKFHPYTKMLPSAGCGIIVCGDKAKQNKTGFLVSDASASIQNMLLAVEGLGLGAVWCGLYPIVELMEPMSELMELPENIIPIGIVAIGVKDETKAPIDRFHEGNIHFDKW